MYHLSLLTCGGWIEVAGVGAQNSQQEYVPESPEQVFPLDQGNDGAPEVPPQPANNNQRNGGVPQVRPPASYNRADAGERIRTLDLIKMCKDYRDEKIAALGVAQVSLDSLNCALKSQDPGPEYLDADQIKVLLSKFSGFVKAIPISMILVCQNCISSS